MPSGARWPKCDRRFAGAGGGAGGGDHALFVCAPSPPTVIHVYYHCVEAEEAARRSELEAIRGTFRVLEPPREEED